MPSPIRAYTNRGQGVFLVLFALQELGGTNTKQEVIARISGGKCYEVTRHDLPPYQGQNEPSNADSIRPEDEFERLMALIKDL